MLSSEHLRPVILNSIVHVHGVAGDCRVSAVGDADTCKNQALRERLPDLAARSNTTSMTTPSFTKVGSLFRVGSSRAGGSSA
eukprot:521544-Pyramimonas_sp.AAC.1